MFPSKFRISCRYVCNRGQVGVSVLLLISRSISSRSPSHTTLTVPFVMFFTCPTSLRLSAISFTCFRNATSCTSPSNIILARSVPHSQRVIFKFGGFRGLGSCWYLKKVAPVSGQLRYKSNVIPASGVGCHAPEFPMCHQLPSSGFRTIPHYRGTVHGTTGHGPATRSSTRQNRLCLIRHDGSTRPCVKRV